MLKKDLGRNKVVVNELINFKWCDSCQNVKEPGAVQSICQTGCGLRLFSKCLPLMKEYGEMESEIEDLKRKINDINI